MEVPDYLSPRTSSGALERQTNGRPTMILRIAEPPGERERGTFALRR